MVAIVVATVVAIVVSTHQGCLLKADAGILVRRTTDASHTTARSGTEDIP